MNSFKKCAEGYVITLFGIFAVICSINLPSNPVKLTGWINFAAQARFLPLVTGIVITLLGIKLILEIKKSEDGSKLFQYDFTKTEALKVFIVVVIVCAYLFAITKIGFMIPTLVYFFAMLFFLNFKLYSPIKLAAISIVFFAVTYYAMPMMLKITLP